MTQATPEEIASVAADLIVDEATATALVAELQRRGVPMPATGVVREQAPKGQLHDLLGRPFRVGDLVVGVRGGGKRPVTTFLGRVAKINPASLTLAHRIRGEFTTTLIYRTSESVILQGPP